MVTRTQPLLAPQAASMAVLRDKYLQAGEATAEDLFARVARALARVEQPDHRALWERRFRRHLQGGGIGAGRIMAAAGTGADARSSTVSSSPWVTAGTAPTRWAGRGWSWRCARRR